MWAVFKKYPVLLQTYITEKENIKLIYFIYII